MAAAAILQLVMVLQKSLLQLTMAPIVAVMEVGLPIALVIVVSIVRQTSPPIVQQTCDYQPPSLPSDGSLVFLQSTACGLNKKCIKEGQIIPQSEIDAERRFGNMQSQLSTFIDNQEKMNSIRKMPSFVSAMNSVAKGLEKPEVQSMLNSNFTVGSFFKNPSKIINFLVDDQKLLPRHLAVELFNSSVNISYFLNKKAILDPRTVVCNSSLLGKFLMVENKQDIYRLSQNLCRINSSNVGRLVELLQAEFDFGKVIRVLSNYQAFLGEFSISTALQDLALLINMAPKFKSFANVDHKQLVSIINWMSTIMQDIVNLVDKNPAIQQIDGIALGLKRLEPLITMIVGKNDTEWIKVQSSISSMNEMLKIATKLLDNISRKKITFGSIVSQSQTILNFLNTSGNDIIKSWSLIMNSDLNLQNYLIAIQRTSAGVSLKEIICHNPGISNLVILAPGNKELVDRTQRKLCSVNETLLLHELQSLMNISQIDKLISSFSQRQPTPTDWLQTLKLLQTIPDNTQAIIGQISNNLKAFAPGINFLSNDFLQNITQANNLEMLEKVFSSMLQSWSMGAIDKEVLHFFNAMNSFLKAVNDHMEKIKNGTSAIEAFLPESGMEKLLDHFVDAIPDLIAAGSPILSGEVNIKLLSKLDDHVLCVNFTLLDLVPKTFQNRTRLRMLSNSICEFSKNMPKFSMIVEKEYGSIMNLFMNINATRENISTTIIADMVFQQERFQQLLNKLISRPETAFAPFNKLVGPQGNRTREQFQRFVVSMQNINSSDPSRYVKPLLEMASALDKMAGSDPMWQTLRREIFMQAAIYRIVNLKLQRIINGDSLVEVLLPNAQLHSFLSSAVTALPDLLDVQLASMIDSKRFASVIERSARELICMNFTFFELLPAEFRNRSSLISFGHNFCTLVMNSQTVAQDVMEVYQPLIKLLMDNETVQNITWSDFYEQYVKYMSLIDILPTKINPAKLLGLFGPLFAPEMQNALSQHIAKFGNELAKLAVNPVEGLQVRLMQNLMPALIQLDAVLSNDTGMIEVKKNWEMQVQVMKLMVQMIEKIKNGSGVAEVLLPNEHVQSLLKALVDAVPDLIEAQAAIVSNTSFMQTQIGYLSSGGLPCLNYTLLQLFPTPYRTRPSLVKLHGALCLLMQNLVRVGADLQAVYRPFLQLFGSPSVPNRPIQSLVQELFYYNIKLTQVFNVTFTPTFLKPLEKLLTPNYQARLNAVSSGILKMFPAINFSIPFEDNANQLNDLFVRILSDVSKSLGDNEVWSSVAVSFQNQVKFIKFLGQMLEKIHNGSNAVTVLLPNAQIQSVFNAAIQAMPDLLEAQISLIKDSSSVQAFTAKMLSGGMLCLNVTLLEAFPVSFRNKSSLKALQTELCKLVINYEMAVADLMKMYLPLITMDTNQTQSWTDMLSEYTMYYGKIMKYLNGNLNNAVKDLFPPEIQHRINKTLAMMASMTTLSESEITAFLESNSKTLGFILSQVESRLPHDSVLKEIKINFYQQVQAYKMVVEITKGLKNGSGVAEVLLPNAHVHALLKALVDAVPDLIEAQAAVVNNTSFMQTQIGYLSGGGLPCLNYTLLQLFPTPYRTRPSLVKLHGALCLLMQNLGSVGADLKAFYAPFLQFFMQSNASLPSQSWSVLITKYTEYYTMAMQQINMTDVSTFVKPFQQLMSPPVQQRIAAVWSSLIETNNPVQNTTVATLNQLQLMMTKVMVSIDRPLQNDDLWRNITMNFGTQVRILKFQADLLEKILNGTNPVVALLPNAQIQNVFGAAIQAMPDLLEAHAGLIKDSSSVQTFTTKVLSGGMLCLNVTLLESFPISFRNKSSLKALQTELCKLVMNYQMAVADLMKVYLPLITFTSGKLQSWEKLLEDFKINYERMTNYAARLASTNVQSVLHSLMPAKLLVQLNTSLAMVMTEIGKITTNDTYDIARRHVSLLSQVMDMVLPNDEFWQSYRKFMQLQVDLLEFIAGKLTIIRNGSSVTEALLPSMQLRAFLKSFVLAQPDLLAVQAALINNSASTIAFNSIISTGGIPCLNYTLLDLFPPEYRTRKSLTDLTMSLCHLLVVQGGVIRNMTTAYQPLMQMFGSFLSNTTVSTTWADLLTKYINYAATIQKAVGPLSPSEMMAVLKPFHNFLDPRMTARISAEWLKVEQAFIRMLKNNSLSAEDNEGLTNSLSQIYTILDTILAKNPAWVSVRNNFIAQYSLLKFIADKIESIQNGSTVLEAIIPQKDAVRLVSTVIAALPDLIEMQSILFNDSSLVAMMAMKLSSGGLPCINFTISSLIPETIRNRPSLVKLNQEFCYFMKSYSAIGMEFLKDYIDLIQLFTEERNGTSNVASWHTIVSEYSRSVEKINDFINMASNVSYISMWRPFVEILTNGALGQWNKLQTSVSTDYNSRLLAGVVQAYNIVNSMYSTSKEWQLFKKYLNATGQVLQLVNRRITTWLDTGNIPLAITETVQLQQLLITGVNAIPVIIREMTRSQFASVSQKISEISVQGTLCINSTLLDILSPTVDQKVKDFSNAICAFVPAIPNVAREYLGVIELFMNPNATSTEADIPKVMTSVMALNATLHRVMASNITSLFQPFTQLVTPGVLQQLQQFLKNFNSTMENSELLSAVKSLQGMLNLLSSQDINYAIGFIDDIQKMILASWNKLKDANYDFSKMFNTTEVKRFFEVVSRYPEILQVIVETSAEMMKNPTKALQWSQQYSKLCTDQNVFTSLVSLPSGVTHGAMYNLICGVVNTSESVLMEYFIKMVPGVVSLMKRIKDLQSNATATKVNFNATQIFMQYNQMFAEVAAGVSKLQPGVDPNIFNSTVLMSLLGPSLGKLLSVAIPNSDAFSTLREYQTRFLPLLMVLQNSDESVKATFGRAFSIMKIVTTIALGGYRNLEQEMNSTDDGRKLLYLAKNILPLVKALVEIESIHPNTMDQLVEKLVELASANHTTAFQSNPLHYFCTNINISAILKESVTSKGLKVSDFWNTLCSVNITKGMPKHIGELLQAVSPEFMNRSMNMNEVSEILTGVISTIKDISAAVNGTENSISKWKKLVSLFQVPSFNFTQNDMGIGSALTTLDGLLPLLNSSDIGRNMVKGMKLISMLMDNVMMELKALGGKNLTLEFILRNAPQLRQMLETVKGIDVQQLLSSPLNIAKIFKWIESGDFVGQLCKHGASEMFLHSTIGADALTNITCSTKNPELLKQAQSLFGIGNIISKASESLLTKSFSFLDFYKKVMQLQSLLGGTTPSFQNIFTQITQLFGKTATLNLTEIFNKLSTSDEWIYTTALFTLSHVVGNTTMDVNLSAAKLLLMYQTTLVKGALTLIDGSKGSSGSLQQPIHVGISIIDEILNNTMKTVGGNQLASNGTKMLPTYLALMVSQIKPLISSTQLLSQMISNGSASAALAKIKGNLTAQETMAVVRLVDELIKKYLPYVSSNISAQISAILKVSTTDGLKAIAALISNTTETPTASKVASTLLDVIGKMMIKGAEQTATSESPLIAAFGKLFLNSSNFLQLSNLSPKLVTDGLPLTELLSFVNNIVPLLEPLNKHVIPHLLMHSMSILQNAKVEDGALDLSSILPVNELDNLVTETFMIEMEIFTQQRNQYLSLMTVSNVSSVLCNAIHFNNTFDTTFMRNSTAAMKTLCHASQKNKLVLMNILKYYKIDDLMKSMSIPKDSSFLKILSSSMVSVITELQKIKDLSKFNPTNNLLKMIQRLLNSSKAGDQSVDIRTIMIPTQMTCTMTMNMMQWMFRNEMQETKRMMQTITYYGDIINAMSPMIKDLPEIVCQMSSMNVGNALTMATKDMDLTRFKSMEESLRPLSCEGLSYAMMNITKYMLDSNLVIQSNWSRIMGCLQNMPNSVNKMAKGMSELDDFLKKTALLQSLPKEMQSLFQILMNTSSANQNILMDIGKLLQNPADANTLLKRLAESVGQSVLSLANATLRVDINSLAKMSKPKLRAVVCNAKELSKVIQPTSNASVPIQAIASLLCNATDQQLDQLLSTLKIAQASKQVSDSIQNPLGFSLAGITNLMNSTFAIIKELQNLLSLLDQFKTASFKNLPTLLVQLEENFGQFLKQAPLDEIVAKANVVLNQLSTLSNSTIMSSLIEDFRMVLAAAKSFKTLNKFFPVTFSVKQFFDDVAKIKMFLIREANMSEADVNLIMDSKLSSFEILKLANVIDLPTIFCNESRMNEVFLLSNQSSRKSTIKELSRAFCKYNKSVDIEKMVETLIKNASIASYITASMNIKMSSILKDSGISANEMIVAMNDIQELMNSMDAFSADDNNVIDVIENIQGGDYTALSAMTSVMCGSNLTTTSFSLPGSPLSSTTVRRRKRSIGAQKTPQDKFCENIIAAAGKTTTGKAIIGLMKPLINGSIFVTPDTPAIRHLMTKVNMTFQQIQNLGDLGKALIDSMNMAGSNASKTLSVLSKAFENPLIGNLLSSAFGSSDMTKSLKAIESMVQGKRGKAMKTFGEIMYNYTSCVKKDRVKFYSSENDTRYREALTKHTVLAAINFHHINDKKTSALPKHVMYSLRMPYTLSMDTNILFERPFPREAKSLFDIRYMVGFMQLQEMIERGIIQIQSGKNSSSLPKVKVQRFPQQCAKHDSFIKFAGHHVIPFFIAISFLSPFLMAINDAVAERESNIEKLLSLMGRNNFMHWSCWFLQTSLSFLIMNIMLTLCLTLAKVLSGVNGWIIFLALLDFGFALTMFGYFISVFFNTTSTALLFAVAIYFLAYIPFTFAKSDVMTIPRLFFDFSMILPIMPMNFFTHYWSSYQISSLPFDWANIHANEFMYSPFWCFLIMFLDGIGYFLLGWFFHNVLGGRRGISQPPYFFLTPRYWGFASKARIEPTKTITQNSYEMNAASTSSSSSGSSNDIVSVSIRNVTKRYRSSKRPAIKDLNLDLRRNEITVLLGPNGAGKSTLLSMITGLTEPSEGSIIIEGCDRQKNFNALRKTIGICTQHESFYPHLTVEQNLKYYASFRGNYSRSEMKMAIQKLIGQVGLKHYESTKAQNLSGGKKRCLSIAIAFIGNPSVVILDEPTSGVDPSARRTIWDLISSQKFNHTILLCTHHMDEAEIIGDRLAILRNGELVASDTPSALRERFGCKYLVSLNFQETTNATDKEDTIQVAKKEISSCEVDAVTDDEVNISVKLSHETKSSMPSFMEMIETSMNNGILKSIGLTFLALETVFLRVIGGRDDSSEQKVSESEQQPLEIMKMRKGSSNPCNNFFTLFYKLGLHTIRHWMSYVGMILIPCILVTVSLASTFIIPKIYEYPSVLLTPTMYGPNARSFLKMPTTMTSGEKYMMNTILRNPGLGTVCMTDKLAKPSFSLACTAKTGTFVEPRLSPAEVEAYQSAKPCKCNAATGTMNCPNEYSKGWPTTTVETMTTDKLVILNGNESSVSKYLKAAEVNSTRRTDLLWGGWEFGLPNDTVKVWYNTKGYHTSPAYYNALSNMILRKEMQIKTNNSESTKYGISLYSHPFINENISYNMNSLLAAMIDMAIALGLLVGLTLIPTSLMLRTLRERISREKFLMQLNGVNPYMYWIANFIWDLLCAALCVGIFALIIFAFKVPTFYSRQNFAATLSIFYLYLFAIIPLTYLICRGFRSRGRAFLFVFAMIVFLAFLMLVLVVFLESMGGMNKQTLATLKSVFMISPPFSMVMGIVKIAENQIKATILETVGISVYKNPFSMDMIGWYLIGLGIEGVVLFIINLLIETSLFKKLQSRVQCCYCYCKGKETSVKYTYREGEISKEDQTVFDEKQRVHKSEYQNHPLIITQLHKTYIRGGSRIQAVSNVSFGVEKGQCFGLLGTNGAGKTSLFKCVTGELMSDEGSTQLLGRSVGPAVHLLNGRVGYCPQNDPLDDMLTLRETLTFYGRLSGAIEPERTLWINQLMHNLGIYEHRNKKVNQLSGGTKRKLSLAIALVGQPDLLLLDEPSSGVDAISKRKIWRVLSAIRPHTAILLTSHSMEEMQMVTNRLAVMVNGKLRAVGTCPELKANFGSTYTIQVWSDPLSAETISHRLSLVFPGCQLKLRKANVSEFTIPITSATFSQIFQSMEEAKNSAIGIREYAVQHTTLEQVFLQLTESQTDGFDSSEVSSDYDSLRSSFKGSSMYSTAIVNKAFVHPDSDDPDILDIRL